MCSAQHTALSCQSQLDSAVQALLSMVRKSQSGASTSEPVQLDCKIQGPFDGHTLSLADERTYSHLVFCAGGIGATAVLAMALHAAARRATADARGALC